MTGSIERIDVEGLSDSAKAQLLASLPVHVGDTIRTTVKIIGVDVERRELTLSTRCFNQDGSPVLRGEAVLRYDPTRMP